MSAATFNEWYEGLPERAQDAVAAVAAVAIGLTAVLALLGLVVLGGAILRGL